MPGIVYCCCGRGSSSGWCGTMTAPPPPPPIGGLALLLFPCCCGGGGCRGALVPTPPPPGCSSIIFFFLSRRKVSTGSNDPRRDPRPLKPVSQLRPCLAGSAVLCKTGFPRSDVVRAADWGLGVLYRANRPPLLFSPPTSLGSDGQGGRTQPQCLTGHIHPPFPFLLSKYIMEPSLLKERVVKYNSLTEHILRCIGKYSSFTFS